MHRTVSRVVLCTAVVLIAWSMAWGQGAKVPAGDRPQSEGERDHPQERARWFLRGRTVNGRPAARELHRAHQQKRENRRLRAIEAGNRSAATQSAVSSENAAPGASVPAPSYVQSTGGPSWVSLGPAPTATAAWNNGSQDYGPAVGRATAVVVDQADPSGNTVYVGGASGGLWRSTNATAACTGTWPACNPPVTWEPLIDDQATLTVGAIALQPGNSSLLLVGTGEANNSADSYYGLGFLRSTDGGANWTLISKTANNLYDFHGLGFTHIAFAGTDKPNTVAATAAATSGGIYVGAETGGSGVRGIYYSVDAGANWLRASVSDGSATPDAGSANAVVYNPARHKFYANLRYHGFYVSDDCISGACAANWTRLSTQPSSSSLNLSLTSCPSVLPANPSCPLYRAEMAVVPGRDEMYVWVVDANDNDKGLFQTLDGGANWTAISTTGIDTCGDGTSNGCGTGTTSQATYNITLAAVPKGGATDLYAGGVNQYKCSIDPALNPTCNAKPFANLTHVYGCSPVGSFAHVHPDEHGVDFLRSNPAVMYFANDGGIYRTLNSFSTQQQLCNTASQPWIQFDDLSGTMGSMIQFVWFSQHPSEPSTLFGGTQDNGSPGVSGAWPSNGNWLSINNGDGGFNDINPLNPSEWFTSNPDMSLGSGIQRCTNGISCTWDPTAGGFSTVVYKSKIGGDSSPFYTVFMLDPQATGVVPGAGRLIVGSCRVWRGDSNGGGTDWSNTGGVALSYNFDNPGSTTACASTAQNMVTALAAGGPCNGTCNPGANAGQATGGGSQVVWAGTDGDNNGHGGQVWVTTTADGGPGTWQRVDHDGQPSCTATASTCSINPLHYPISGIAVDPHDATGKTAYVTVMGFNTGHVFKTSDAGLTWAKLDGAVGGAGLPDNPADAVVAQPLTDSLGQYVRTDVYVGTDVGVFKSSGDGVWTELGPGTGSGALPNVVVTALKVYKNADDIRLRASTYGRGLWEIAVPRTTTPTYVMNVSSQVVSAFPGQPATFTGTISTFNGYTGSVTITCGAGAPSSCIGQTVAAPGNFIVTASDRNVNDFTFNLVGVGDDANNVQQQVPVTLQVSDFHVTAPQPASAAQGSTATTSFNVVPDGSFAGSVSLSCTGMPIGTSCSFSPPTVTLTKGVSATVQLDISTSLTTPLGNQTVTINAVGAGNWTRTQSATFTVTTSSFALSATNLSPSPAKPGKTLSATVNFSTVGAYPANDLTVKCEFDPASGGWGTSTCAMNPPSVHLDHLLSPTGSSVLSVNNTSGAPAANPHVIVTATDGTNSNSLNLGYSIIDYSFTAGAPATLVPGSSVNITASLTALNGYSSNVGVQCAPQTPLTCSLSPAGPYAVAGSSTSITATVTAPTGTPAGAYSVAVNSNDAAYTSLKHDQTLSIQVQDFSMSASPASNSVKAGTSSTHTISMIAGLGGFASSVNLAVSGCPQLTTCAFSQNQVSAGGSTTLTITTTAPSVSQMLPPAGCGAAPLYALWLTMPGAMGLIGMAAAPRRRRSKLLACIGLTLIAGALLLLASCGGDGGSSTTSPPVPKPGTPAGTYNIVVTGTYTSGTTVLSRTTPITLTVQ